jgi:hypothetical protein
MDRISAIRNVEEALREFEAGECDLATLEARVGTVLRTYATEFESGDDRRVYRAVGDEAVDGRVVVAASPADARDRVRDLAGGGGDDGEVAFEVERL